MCCCLHGFSSNNKEFFDKIGHLVPPNSVFLKARLRNITCYNNKKYRGWHDYYTAFGDESDCNAEEVISHTDLLETREYLHNMINKLKEESNHIVLIGESQGGCVAIDAALTTHVNVSVIASYCQLYSCTLNDKNFIIQNAKNIHLFHSTVDNVIPWRVTQQNIQKIPINITLVHNHGHAEMSDKYEDFVTSAIRFISQKLNIKL